MDKDEIHRQIISLKAIKKTSKNPCALELIRTTGYVNIIDMLLLPLYYKWEKSNFGTLEEVNFENYLTKAYNRYCLSTNNYNNQMIIILQKTSTKKKLSNGTKSVVYSLIEIYTNSI